MIKLCLNLGARFCITYWYYQIIKKRQSLKANFKLTTRSTLSTQPPQGNVYIPPAPTFRAALKGMQTVSSITCTITEENIRKSFSYEQNRQISAT